MLGKKKAVLLCILMLFFVASVKAKCSYLDLDSNQEVDCDYTSPDFYNNMDYSNSEIDWSQVQWDMIPPERISEVPPAQLDLEVLNGDQLAQVSQTQWQAKGFNVNSIRGQLSDAKVVGNNIILGDGSQYDLKSGQKIDLEVASDGSTKSFTNNNGVSFFNAKGVNYNGLTLTVASADSLSWYGPTLTKILDFSGQSGTFSVKSADRVIIETMTFDKIVNSIFKVSNGNLMTASVECNKNNSQTKFPNLIAGTSTFITSNCDDNEEYFVSYRETANEIIFNLSSNMSLILHGVKANITFNASENSSLIIKPNGVFAVKNGILSYVTETFTEQLQGSCSDYSTVSIDFEKGFLKTALYPFKNYQTGVFICPGARYNRIYKEKEDSYSIYNIGKSTYYLVFDKNLQLFSDLFSSNKNKDDYGFITENISLNGNIQYDRYPEKNIFPALSVEEYASLPLDWKKVYAGYDPAMRIVLTGQNKISISAKNYNGTDDVSAEINSGYFNIRQKGASRFARFNKNMTYPDYVSEFRYNNEPLIKIENKKLVEINDGKLTVLHTPNTEESSEFLNWLKLKLALKELSEVIGRIFGTNNLQVEVS